MLDKMRQRSSILYVLAKRFLTRKLKKVHFGQVVPLEDVQKIFQINATIARITCACRKATKGKEIGACFVFSVDPHRRFGYPLDNSWPDYSTGPEVTQVENDACEQFCPTHAITVSPTSAVSIFLKNFFGVGGVQVFDYVRSYFPCRAKTPCSDDLPY